MRIAIAGTGYVGLVTGVCLAHMGHEVTCVEANAEKLATLQSGKPAIYEAGVEELMKSEAARLTYTGNFRQAYNSAEVIFICVGTPERADGYANLKQVYQVAEQIAEAAQSSCVVVMKSTVPMGTNGKLEKLFAMKASRGVQIEVASNPEFLSQGTAVRDFMQAQRIVLGVKSPRCEEVLRQVYAGFGQPVVVTDPCTAEMIKYASNNFLALKISFINEIANLCELVGADAETVALGMGLDSRISGQYLRCGIGYGGSCFPKDTKALHWLAKYYDYELKTVKAAIEVNENQKVRLTKKARKYYTSLEGLTVAVLGLAFKPGTDDLREAPSLQNIAILLEEGAKVKAWDPVATPHFKALYPSELTYCDTIEAAIEGADLCLIFTEWEAVKRFDLGQYARLMKRPIVIDGRNCYPLAAAAEAKITYDSIGRKSTGPIFKADTRQPWREEYVRQAQEVV